MLRLFLAGLLVALLHAPAAAQTATAPQATQDYLKQAGNFLTNCDARADENGQRPEPNYICLAFMAGLIEGYTTGAIANGNPQPYCLPRPTSLAELADMMVTVIERGAPKDTPTATVFHFILDANFQCPDNAANAPADPSAPIDPPAANEN